MQYHRTIKDTPYHLVYGMHPCDGISNLPISQSVLSNLVTDAQLNEVYCKLAEDPRQDTAELPESFHDQVVAVKDAANAGEAMVPLSLVQN